jgi:tRNA A-37 threonylcarbamoyl transferase component Bud32
MSEPSDSRAANETLTVRPALTEKPGDKIGRYKLLQQLGEGGCGVVYMAEQEEPVQRRVAVKVIKLGMDTKAVIARFEAERQALAMMDHPNIARVLDAGATETGRPFFVMELVRGIRITDYCDQNKLGMAERLKLFIQVCQAIQHAHQKGIIHRDIKPSNILVTLHDGVPVPKVIDFGIAKATQGRLTDQTLFTAFEQFIGTPAYMSPEQAEMSGLDIDTRSDVYALGVLLYELLTSRTPFDARELLEAGLDKLRETIREKEPERPSTRLATMLDADATEVARRRQSDAPKLVHSLRGDLDWIVMKCLEKDRTRRYETANGLAMDVVRYLKNETVLARPPSAVYRFQKLVRRNKLAFAAAGAVMLALFAGAVVSTVLFIREREARKRADAAERVQAALLKEAEAGRAAEAKMRKEAEIGQKFAEAGRLVSEQKFDQAELMINEMPPRAEGVAWYHSFGTIHAGRKEWREAITNFSKEIQFAPSNHLAYHYLAPLLVQVGDVQAYERLRGTILRQFGESSDPRIAERMAKDCLILAPPATDLPAIQRMADTAMAAGPSHPLWEYFQFAKGFTEYREGHFEKAIEWLEKISSGWRGKEAEPYRSAEAYFLIAMARHQLHQFWPARGAFSEGSWVATRFLPPPDAPAISPNVDWIIVQLLMREAQALIETSPNNEAVVKAFDALVGRYDCVASMFTFTRNGNHLSAKVTGGTEMEIFPRSDTEFFWNTTDAEVTFEKDSSGKAVKAVYKANDSTVKATRMEDIVEAHVDPATYDALVGKYDYGQDRVMTVTREGNRLFAKITNQPKLELVPTSNLEFSWKEANAQVRFVKDEQGKVTRAIHHQGGGTIDAPKIE